MKILGFLAMALVPASTAWGQSKDAAEKKGKRRERVVESSLTRVPLGIVEALSDGDSRASQGFKRSYESALFHILGLKAAKIASCGYAFDVHTHYYDASHPESALEAAERLDKEGAWFAIGPSNSKHYLIFTRKPLGMATVSLMAGARQVKELPPPNFSVYPSASVLARRAVEHAMRVSKGRRVGSFITEDCITCREFAEEFRKHGEGKFDFKWSVGFVGDKPDLGALEARLNSDPVDILLLPASSRPTANTLVGLSKRKSTPLFVGMDGWGNDEHPLLQNYPISPSIQGFCVRGEVHRPSAHAGGERLLTYRLFSQDAELKETYSIRALDLVLERFVDRLCSKRPRKREDFVGGLRAASRDEFSGGQETAVFTLQGSSLRREGPPPTRDSAP